MRWMAGLIGDRPFPDALDRRLHTPWGMKSSTGLLRFTKPLF